MPETVKKFVSIAFSLNIFVYTAVSLPIQAYALEGIPNRDEVRNQILQEAQAQSQQPSTDSQSEGNPTPSEQSTDQQPTTNTEVTNTGDDTSVSNASDSSNTTTVDNTNYSEINQNIDATANTGYNQANGNISVNGGGAGIIQTGDASVTVVGVVSAGSNATGISGGSDGASSGSDVVNSGDGLEVSSTASDTTYKIVRNRNTTIIHQVTDATANTGYNQAEGNISVNGGPAGLIITGNASTNVNYLVSANGNVTIIGGSGADGSWDGASILLGNTGQASRFNTSTNTTHLTLVTNENRALISQACGRPIGPREVAVDMTGCYANTGYNHADGQIAFDGNAGVIQTGDAAVNVAMNASANSNTTDISGGPAGARAQSDVLNTGDGVDVNTSANSDSSATVNNYNDARVNQSVNAYANTGWNTANGNISFGGIAGWIQTGNATVNVIMSADVNNNNTTIAEGSAGLGNGATNGTSVLNTGDNVSVDTSSNSNTSIEVTNMNVLQLTQRVYSYANTGNNLTGGNIGSVAGIIVTGDANSSTSMGVQANTNCTLVGDSNTTCPTPPRQQSTDNAQQSTTQGAQPTANSQQLTTNQGGVGGANVAGSSSSSSNSSPSSSPSTAGQVLGAVLPATGPEAGMMMVGLSIVGMFVGMRFKKLSGES